MKTAASQIKRLHDFNELADLCERFVQDIGRRFTEGARELNVSQGFTESCKSCKTAGCCYQQVTCTIIEAIPIARKLRREGKSTMEFRQSLRRTGEEMESVPHGHWFNLSRPCMFLTPELRCSIYDVRPTTCSTYLVVETPPEWCSPPVVPGRKVGVADTSTVSEIMLEQQRRLQLDLGLPPVSLMMGALPKMVGIVLEAMTKPWEEFVPYLWEHAQLTLETLDKQVSVADVLYSLNPTPYKKGMFNGESNVPSERGTTAVRDQTTKREGSDR